MLDRASVAASLVALAMIAPTPTAAADALPPKPVRIIVPFAPAGFPDRVARVLASEMSQTHPQGVIVENRPGAGGIPGSVGVARAEPDGSTLLMSTMPTLVLAPLINPRSDFRPIEDFAHISHIGGPPNGFVVAATSPIKSFADLLAASKSKPLSYGTAGVGSVGHLNAVFVGKRAGADFTHVPYNGPMIPDILSGVVDFGSLTISTVSGNLEGGTLRGLAMGTEKRMPQFPNVPTFRELGYDIAPIAWMAISAPSGMPRDMQIALNKWIGEILARPRMKETLRIELIEPMALSPEQLTDFVRKEIRDWTPIVESVGLRQQ